MRTFRFGVILLYAFLITVALTLVAYAYKNVTSPLFGKPFMLPNWVEPGMDWSMLVLAIAAASTAVVSCWGLAQRREWAPPLARKIAWFTLFIYPGISLVSYAAVINMGKVRVPFFAMFDYTTVVLTVLSIAALAILYSKQWSIEYSSSRIAQE